MKKQRLILLALIVLALIAISLGFWHFLKPLASSAEHPDQVRAWAARQGWSGYFIIIGMTMVQVLIAVIPAGPVELAAGFAYGPVVGTLLCTIGFIFSSSIAFILVKTFGEKVVLFFFGQNKLNNVHFLQREDRLTPLTFLIFMIPGTPKDLLTYVLGLTPMTVSTFLIVSNLARIPATFVSTYAGEALLQKDYGQVVIIFLIVAVLSGIGYLIYRKINKKRQTRRKHH